MISMEDIEKIAKLNGIEIIENPTQEELEEHSESLLLSLADIVDYRQSLCRNCTWKDNCKHIVCECLICNSSNEWRKVNKVETKMNLSMEDIAKYFELVK